MPNWCQNKLRVTGPKNELERFREENRSGELEVSFSKLLPLPVNLEGTDRCANTDPAVYALQLAGQAPPTDWYTWRVQNWGTKWEPSSTSFTKEDDAYLYEFDTAWSPPLAWLKTASGKYPELAFEIKYYEAGCDYFGHEIYKDGNKKEVHTGRAKEVHPEEGFGDYF